MSLIVSQQSGNNGYAPSVGSLPLDVWSNVAELTAKVGANVLENVQAIASFLRTCRTLNRWQSNFTQLFQDARVFMEPKWIPSPNGVDNEQQLVNYRGQILATRPGYGYQPMIHV
jgi:hypothetical protein